MNLGEKVIIWGGESDAKYYSIFWLCICEDRSVVLTELLERTEVCLA